MPVKKAANKSKTRSTVSNDNKKKMKSMPEDEQDVSELESPLQRKMWLEWEAPVRPYRKLDKELFSTILAGAVLLGVILFFIDGAIPVIALASLVFLFYVLGTVPPGKVKHVITSWGIESEDKSWPWEVMGRFWIEGKDKNRMMIVEVSAAWWSSHLRFMLGDLDEEKLRELMQQFVVEDRPKANWLDRASRWVETKVRLVPED